MAITPPAGVQARASPLWGAGSVCRAPGQPLSEGPGEARGLPSARAGAARVPRGATDQVVQQPEPRPAAASEGAIPALEAVLLAASIVEVAAELGAHTEGYLGWS